MERASRARVVNPDHRRNPYIGNFQYEKHDAEKTKLEKGQHRRLPRHRRHRTGSSIFKLPRSSAVVGTFRHAPPVNYPVLPGRGLLDVLHFPQAEDGATSPLANMASQNSIQGFNMGGMLGVLTRLAAATALRRKMLHLSQEELEQIPALTYRDLLDRENQKTAKVIRRSTGRNSPCSPNAHWEHINATDAKTLVSSFERSAKGQGICVICTDDFQDLDLMRPLPCGHLFHKKCIDCWLLGKHSCVDTQTTSCPICKEDVRKTLLGTGVAQTTIALQMLDRENISCSSSDSDSDDKYIVLSGRFVWGDKGQGQGRDQDRAVTISPRDEGDKKHRQGTNQIVADAPNPPNAPSADACPAMPGMQVAGVINECDQALQQLTLWSLCPGMKHMEANGITCGTAGPELGMRPTNRKGCYRDMCAACGQDASHCSSCGVARWTFVQLGTGMTDDTKLQPPRHPCGFEQPELTTDGKIVLDSSHCTGNTAA